MCTVVVWLSYICAIVLYLFWVMLLLLGYMSLEPQQRRRGLEPWRDSWPAKPSGSSLDLVSELPGEGGRLHDMDVDGECPGLPQSLRAIGRVLIR